MLPGVVEENDTVEEIDTVSVFMDDIAISLRSNMLVVTVIEINSESNELETLF